MEIEDAPDLDPALHELLVIGHEEYRRVTYRAIHFRRAFAEVFRQRSLLFLGSGISETYLQELFGEVLELYGPSARPHYALMPKGKVDPDFMLSRFQIIVATYDPKNNHVELREGLIKLKEAIDGAIGKQIRWTWGRASLRNGSDRGGLELEVVRGPLPDRPPKDKHGKPYTEHCLAVSAGGRNRFVVSENTASTLKGWGVTVSDRKSIDYKKHRVDLPDLLGQYVRYSPEQHVYAVRARSDDNQRVLSAVHEASFELFTNASQNIASSICSSWRQGARPPACASISDALLFHTDRPRLCPMGAG